MQKGQSSLLDYFDVRESVTDSLQSAMETLGKKIAQDALHDQVAAILAEATSDLASKFVGAFVGSLLRFLFGIRNELSQKLNKVIRAPFETGLRVATEALSLDGNGDDQCGVRERRLFFAIEELDRAITLTEGTEKDAVERNLIRLLQGLCALEIRGGRSLARSLLSPVAVALATESQAMAKEAAVIKSVSNETYRRATCSEPRQMERQLNSWVPMNAEGRLAVIETWEYARVEAGRLHDAANSQKRQAEEYERRSKDVAALAAILRAL